MRKDAVPAEAVSLAKCRTGIQGLDEVTGGGLPRGRPTLVCGAAGCGKTLLAMEFLMHGALEYDEPGVFMAFEENAQDLAENFASLGFDLPKMVADQQLLVDFVHVERSEIEEAGEYDLEGLFVRLNHAINSIGAKRVVLDTIESLFSGFSDENLLRAELRRLFRWLKSKGVTAVITGESRDNHLTRRGLEEYVSDCVIALDHRVTGQLSTRRLRVVKYRGSSHGTNEYPFVISKHGMSVMPITSIGLAHEASTERVPTGVSGLDAMIEGGGYYRGSSVLVSGTAGTGKSSVSAHFAAAACRRGEKCLYFAFEESPSQIIRNMRSIGVDLAQFVETGLLEFHATRPTVQGMEALLASVHDVVTRFGPSVVVFDPITNMLTSGALDEVKSMLTRLVDFLKTQGATALFTSLTEAGELEETRVGISSLMDTWLLLQEIRISGERNRALYILKSRGMAHSNQVFEFFLTDHGIQLREVYVGPGEILTGSARAVQEAKDRADTEVRRQEIARRRHQLERNRTLLEARIAALQAEFDTDEEDVRLMLAQSEIAEETAARAEADLAALRRGAGRKSGQTEEPHKKGTRHAT